MPDEVKTFSGSLVLDLRIWWRHVRTLSILLRDFLIVEISLKEFDIISTIHVC